MDVRQGLRVAVALGWLLCAAPTEAGTRVGLSAGALCARFANGGGDPGQLEREPRWAWGGGGGLVVEHALSGPFAFVAGLEYARLPDVARVTNHGVQFFSGGQGYELRALWTIEQDVVLLPLRLEYRRGPLRAGGGPQVRYLVRARREGSESEFVPLTPLYGRPAAAPGRADLRGRRDLLGLGRCDSLLRTLDVCGARFRGCRVAGLRPRAARGAAGLHGSHRRGPGTRWRRTRHRFPGGRLRPVVAIRPALRRPGGPIRLPAVSVPAFDPRRSHSR